MKRVRVALVFVLGMIFGLVSVYSCGGGGGSTAVAAGDADTLDGYHAAGFSLSSHAHADYAASAHDHSQYASTGHGHLPGEISPQGAGSGLDADLVDGAHRSDLASAVHAHAAGDIGTAGLDSDTLDGQHGADYALTTHQHGAYLDSAQVDVRVNARLRVLFPGQVTIPLGDKGVPGFNFSDYPSSVVYVPLTSLPMSCRITTIAVYAAVPATAPLTVGFEPGPTLPPLYYTGSSSPIWYPASGAPPLNVLMTINPGTPVYLRFTSPSRQGHIRFVRINYTLP